MNNNIRKQIKAHAEDVFPREACGLIVDIGGTMNYIACRNIAKDNETFILDPKDYLACEKIGTITALVHSHPNGTEQPSQADLVSCEACGLPWHIYATPLDKWGYCEPSGYKAPLLGRIFVHGILDCYTLIQDWYRENRGVELPDFERNHLWWNNGENIYVENFSKAGFYRVTEGTPQHGDVLLMQILSPVPNHGAIYLDGDILLHHLYNRVSTKEIWGGYYRKHTTHILRYGTEEKDNT